MKPNRCLTAVCFALALCQPLIARTIEEVVAKVNDAVLTKSDFEKRLKTTQEGMRREYKGPDLDARLKDVPQRLLDQMVEELLLVEKAKQLYQIDALVDYQVENFMKDNKLDSKEALAKALEQEGMTMEEFRKQVKMVYVPEFLKSREVRNRISISTDEITAYYESHKADLASEASARLQEIFLAKPQTGDDAARAVAAEVEKALAEGRDFGELAALHSQSSSRSNQGDAGWYKLSDLSPSLSSAVFSTPAGKTTPLLTTPGGYFIFRVKERREPKVPEMGEARDIVIERLKEEKFQKTYKEYLDILKAENYVWINPKYV